MSDDLHQPEQPSLPARRQHRAARAAGGPGLSQSQLDSGLQRPGELGEEPALCCHAVSGQTWRHLLNVYPIEFKIVGVIHKMWFDLNCSPLIQEFHETLHSLLLWLAQAEDKLRTVNVNDRSHSALLQHRDTLTVRQTIVFLVLPYFCTNIMLTLMSGSDKYSLKFVDMVSSLFYTGDTYSSTHTLSKHDILPDWHNRLNILECFMESCSDWCK